ncbi:MAG: hypothetical protein IJW18_05345 [Lachnospiraceae bacterium]|nr:hypothetical protein [Lachnospiraceae bacterium]
MKDISALALLIKSSLYKILALIVEMTIIEFFIFYYIIDKGQNFAESELMITKAYIPYTFLAMLAIAFMVLCFSEKGLDKKSGYTIQRMRISKKRFFVIKTIYNVFCIVLLFVVQTLVAIVLIRNHNVELIKGEHEYQQLFLAFYRNDFLHSLFPMAEVLRWIRNVLLVLALGMQAAVSEKKSHVGDFCLISLTVSWFSIGMGTSVMDVFCYIAYLIVIAVALVRVFSDWSEED